MDNEKYQLQFQKVNKEKFEKNQEFYHGDITSDIFLSIVKKYINGICLDIGAGTGALVSRLSKRGHTVYGIDLLPKVDFIKKGSIDNLSFDDKSIDTVFCTEVLEHLTTEQITAGLKEIKRVLGDNGCFIISVPLDEDLEKNKCVCPNCKHKFHKVGHLQSFNYDTMQELLNKNGFKMVFYKTCALGAMAKLPFGRYLNHFFMRLNYESISKNMIIVCRKN